MQINYCNIFKKEITSPKVNKKENLNTMPRPTFKTTTFTIILGFNTAVLAQEPEQSPAPETFPTPPPFFSPIDESQGGENYCDNPDRNACMYCPPKPPATFS